MKTLTLVVIFSFSVFNMIHGQGFEKLDDSKVNAERLKSAKEFANSYFTRLRYGSFYKFKDEAIDQVKNQLTEKFQKDMYQQLKNQFGDYSSLEYAETCIQKSGALEIYRFKSTFDKYSKKLELRVVLDKEGKISGFWIKPWEDMLK